MELRDYQKDAIDSFIRNYNAGYNNSLIVIPTGGGKTPVISDIVVCFYKHNKSVCILTHRSELITQNYDTLCRYRNGEHYIPEKDIGIYCAMLNQKDTEEFVIIGSIQSVANQCDSFEPFDLIIVDEAHLIPPTETTQYQRFLTQMRQKNPRTHLLGLTATPHRTGEGLLYATEEDTEEERESKTFDQLTYEISIAELIYENYLTKLTSFSGEEVFDLQGVKKAGGEFVAKQLNERMDAQEGVFYHAVNEMVQRGKNRRSWVVFTSSIEQVYFVSDLLEAAGIDNEVITGETPHKERVQIIEDFKAGHLRCIVNCKVLTTGFDAPNIDLIVLLMATASPSLYVQIMGRGTRNAPDKKDCLVLDYGGNVERHGCVDDVDFQKKKKGRGEAPVKKCPACNALLALRILHCPHCGHQFEAPKGGKLTYHAWDESLIKTQKLPVDFLDAETHTSKKGHQGLKIQYYVPTDNDEHKIVTWFMSPNSSEKARNYCNWTFRRMYHCSLPDDLEKATDIIKNKPVPKYILCKENDSGYLEVKKACFY